MPNDIDKSLLDRLQALRGGAAGSHPSQAPQNIKVDVIERAKTPSREDALTARLRSLREDSATPEPEGQRASPKLAAQRAPGPSVKQAPTSPDALYERNHSQENMDDVFETDDDTLQELLADLTPDEDLGAALGAHEPSDEQVKALLDQLANDIPKDADASSERRGNNDAPEEDDSDSEAMKRKVKDVMGRYQDEAELEPQGDERGSDKEDFQDPHDEATHDAAEVPDLALPSVPSDLQHLTTPPRSEKPGLDNITARLAALRTPSHNTDGGGDDEEGGSSLDLPSVPTSRPSSKPAQQRLQTRTKYTDDDADGWCTVCLEDATLRCLGCDDGSGDVYCARCWREMHVGPAAAFDDSSHRAVQFTRDKKKEKRKVALGA